MKERNSGTVVPYFFLLLSFFALLYNDAKDCSNQVCDLLKLQQTFINTEFLINNELYFEAAVSYL